MNDADNPEFDWPTYKARTQFESGRCVDCHHPQKLHVLPTNMCPRYSQDYRVYVRTTHTPPGTDGFYGWIRWHPDRLVLLNADDTVNTEIPLHMVESLCGLVGQDREAIQDRAPAPQPGPAPQGEEPMLGALW